MNKKPVSEFSSRFTILALLLVPCFASASDKIDFSADNYETNLETRITKARGNVVVQFEEKTLTADAVDFNPSQKIVSAEGNVVLTEGSYQLTSSSAQLSTDDSSGSFYDASIKSDSGLYVSGTQIQSLGDDKFRIENGKLTYCKDCPHAWSVFGATIDFEVEEYAEIHHALFQVKDMPVAYFPVFYFPIKTKRQSGFLLPQYTYSSELGSQLAFPYFWAISKDQDATTEYSYLTEGGHRAGLEHRYRYSSRSYTDSVVSYNNNLNVENVGDHRYGFSASGRWQWSPNLVQRAESEIASDARYVDSFDADFDQFRMPTLTTRTSLAWQNTDHVAWIQGSFEKDNLIRGSNFQDSFRPIYTAPELYWAYPSFELLGPLRLAGSLEHKSFRRAGAAVDPETGWIREGDRSSAQARFFVPYYLLNVISAESSMEFRGDIYRFPSEVPDDSTAARGRVVFEEVVKAEFSSVSELDWGSLKKIKHTVVPEISWSYSPNDWITEHRFFSNPQEVFGRELDPPKFDVFDPSDADEVIELSTGSIERRLRAHHLLSWGVGTRLIGRFDGEGDRRNYSELLGAKITQDYDIRNNIPKAYIITAFGAYAGYKASTQIAIDPDTGDANLRNDISLTRTGYAVSLRQTIREDLEQYSGRVSLRNLGAWRLGYKGVYDAENNRIIEDEYRVRYESSASECWFFSLTVDRKPDPDTADKLQVRFFPRIGFLVKNFGDT